MNAGIDVSIDLRRLASRFIGAALGGIIFSQMLTPAGGRHKPFQTGFLDLTEPKN